MQIGVSLSKLKAMTLSLESVLDASILSLDQHARDLDEEQSVRGIDALAETQLHPIIALGIECSGSGVARERCYPSLDHDNPSRVKRQRCDLVVLPSERHDLVDPVLERHEQARASETLFGGVELATSADRARCEPSEALWIEIKSIAQHACRDGVYTPNHAYANELTTGLSADIAKLASDELIEHACVLLVLFAEDAITIEHDALTAVSYAAGIGLPVRSPIIESRAITDRGGNGAMGVVLAPIAL